MTDYAPRDVARLRRLIATKGQYPITFRITANDRDRLDRLMRHYRNLGLDPSVTTIMRVALVKLDEFLSFTLTATPETQERERENTVAVARGRI